MILLMFRLLLLAAALAALCSAVAPFLPHPGCIDLNAGADTLLTTAGPSVSAAINITNPYFPDATEFSWEAQYQYVIDPPGPNLIDYNDFFMSIYFYCGQHDVYAIDEYYFPISVNYTRANGYMIADYNVIRQGALTDVYCPDADVNLELSVRSSVVDTQWNGAGFRMSVNFRYGPSSHVKTIKLR